MGIKPGFKWYNNGKIEKVFYQNDTIPDGFVKGRLKFSEQALLNMSISQKEAYKRNPELSKQNSERMKKLWQTPEYREKTIKAQKEGWTEEARKCWSEKNMGKKLPSSVKLKIKEKVTEAYKNPETHKK